jgi:hypothetical protein
MTTIMKIGKSSSRKVGKKVPRPVLAVLVLAHLVVARRAVNEQHREVDRVEVPASPHSTRSLRRLVLGTHSDFSGHLQALTLQCSTGKPSRPVLTHGRALATHVRPQLKPVQSDCASAKSQSPARLAAFRCPAEPV